MNATPVPVAIPPVAPIDPINQPIGWLPWLERVSIWRLLLVCVVASILLNNIVRMLTGNLHTREETPELFEQAVVEQLENLAKEFHLYNTLIFELLNSTIKFK
jgi:hypothetical protein